MVHDAGGQDAPALTADDPDSEYGRGSAIIGASGLKGSHAVDGGRVTWCRLSNRRTAVGAAGREPEPEAA